jgi:hypothetical protein
MRLAARPAAAARLFPEDLRFRLPPVLFFALLRAGAALRVAVVFFEAADLRVPARLRTDVALRAELRFRALDLVCVDALFRLPRDADFLAPLFRPLVFLVEVVRLREPTLLFLPPFELLRDDFLAAVMI